MVTIKLYILSVALSAWGANVDFDKPHKYYPDQTTCEKAGRQWERTAKSVYGRTVGGNVNFSCEEQTVLIPAGESK